MSAQEGFWRKGLFADVALVFFKRAKKNAPGISRGRF
jgi:hypothetical protein